MDKIGSGILTWCSTERSNDRYGTIVLDHTNYERTVFNDIVFNTDIVEKYIGKHVRLIAIVTESRKSSHCGDLTYNIKPTMPEEGVEITIGIGEFFQEDTQWSKYPAVGLKPDTERTIWWLNPYILYNLHDQSIELFIEETTEPSSVFSIPKEKENMYILSDNGIQIKTKKTDIKKIELEPQIIPIGNGTFMVKHGIQGKINIIE